MAARSGLLASKLRRYLQSLDRFTQRPHSLREIHLLDATGSVLHVATNDHAKVGMSQVTATTTGAEPEETGWVAYASWLNEASAAISSFATSFTVPPLPEDNHDQTLFMFNSIEPASGDAILQPVRLL